MFPFILAYLSIAAAVQMIKTEKVGDKMNVGLIKLDRPKALNALCNQLMQEVNSPINLLKRKYYLRKICVEYLD